MIAMHLSNISMLYLLWALPVLAGVYAYAQYRRRSALKRFADAAMLERINVSVSPSRRRWKAGMIVLACGCIVFALARPGWNPKARTLQRTGRDVVFVLDVSRSMLAEDLAPNRLERAKLAIRDCVEKLQGDRVGLVAFAGSAVIKCPLTLDYGFFRMMLDDTTPESVSKAGTNLGDAIRKTLAEVFDDQVKQYKDIVLITDGEDHDSFPVQAAEKAGQRGVRIIALGLGDENQGKRIPITNDAGVTTFMTYQGKEVWSKLDADTLRKMVNVTPGGKYLNVGTGTIDFGQVYAKLVGEAEKTELEARTIKRYEEKFQIFLALAFVIACIEMVTGERRKARANDVKT